jgi:pimeloyl-ACP methyl ester carboxylesterase
MAIAPINGIDYYFEEHGAGPAVVFAHGVGGNHASWFQQVPFFCRYYRTVTMDQRGFGRSLDTNGLGRGNFVDDLRALLDYLGIEKACLVAQSMGGSTMMGFAVQYPQRVSALVMADTLVGITLPDELRTRQQQNAEATRNLSQLERVVARDFPKRNPNMAELYLEVASFNANNDNRFSTPPGSVQAKPIVMDEIIAAAKTVPMLFLVGREDVLQPPEIVSAASRMIPNAQLTIVPDAGHSVYWESPDVFNFEVQRFLARALSRD